MYDRRTLVKIAHWYYELGLTQDQIARRLLCSRQRINKVVNSLVDDGVVTISINGLGESWISLENALESRFSLKQVVVADSGGDPLAPGSVLGKTAARFLDGFIQDGKLIGVSWGFTLGDAIFNMRSVNKGGCTVLQLVGGLNTEQRMIRPDELTRMLSNKLQCDYRLLYAPAIIENEAAREIVIHEDAFREAAEEMERCDIAIVGVGELNREATSFNQGYIAPERLERLQQNGYIGDICLTPYNETGQWEARSRIIGASIATLKKIPNVIAIAGGYKKARAILGALRVGCVDILITDSEAAKEIARLADVAY